LHGAFAGWQLLHFYKAEEQAIIIDLEEDFGSC